MDLWVWKELALVGCTHQPGHVAAPTAQLKHAALYTDPTIPGIRMSDRKHAKGRHAALPTSQNQNNPEFWMKLHVHEQQQLPSHWVSLTEVH